MPVEWMTSIRGLARRHVGHGHVRRQGDPGHPARLRDSAGCSGRWSSATGWRSSATRWPTARSPASPSGYLGVLLGARRTRRPRRGSCRWSWWRSASLVGAGMVYVRERTGLRPRHRHRRVLRLAIGFGAMLFQVLAVESSRSTPRRSCSATWSSSRKTNLFFLCALVVVVAPLFAWRYNQLVFASFNPSLARTRGLSTDGQQLPVHRPAGAGGEPLDQGRRGAAHQRPAGRPGGGGGQLSREPAADVLADGGVLPRLRAARHLDRATNSSVRVDRGRSGQVRPERLIVVTSVALFFASMAGGAVWNRFAPVLGLTPLPRRIRRHVHDDTCAHDHALRTMPLTPHRTRRPRRTYALYSPPTTVTR